MDTVTTDQNRVAGSILAGVGGVIAGTGAAAVFVFAVSSLGLALLGVLVSYIGMRLLNRGRRHFVPIGLDAIADDPRPPVLYLRPFADDGADFQISPSTIDRGLVERGSWRQFGTLVRFMRTNEQFLAHAFRDIGPLVAIGDPAEELPRLGAVRVYARTGDDWKAVVADLTARAPYVILQIGLSEGVLWEVDFVVDHVRPDQLILCLPNERIRLFPPSGPKKRERRRQEHYQHFRSASSNDFPIELPEHIGNAQFMYFDRDWTPRPAYPERELVFPFGRRVRHPDDPKLEALNWLTSVLN